MSLRTLAIAGKVFAVTMLVVGAVCINARSKQKDNKPESFVITFRVTTVRQGRPTTVGLIVHADNGKGGIRETRVLDDGTGTLRSQTRLVDNIAAYNLEGDHLEYIVATGEERAQGERNARLASWAASSPDFVREDTWLGMKAYVVRQKIQGGFIESWYSPLLGRLALFDKQVEADVEITREAVSIQFRPVSDDEVAVPDIPIRFDRALHKISVFKDGDAAAVKSMGMAEEMLRATKEKLRASGRRLE